jgi:HD superfamily phosphohydrolase YqeK
MCHVSSTEMTLRLEVKYLKSTYTELEKIIFLHDILDVDRRINLEWMRDSKNLLLVICDRSFQFRYAQCLID